MDVIETAIRNAFEKGDSSDRAFRERVYRSAFSALERALKANPGVTVEMAITRRKRLQAKIAEIESEFIPAAPAVSAGPDDDAGVAQAEATLSRVSIEPRAEPPTPPRSGPAAGAGAPAPAVAGQEPGGEAKPDDGPGVAPEPPATPLVEPAPGRTASPESPLPAGNAAPAVDGETSRDAGSAGGPRLDVAPDRASGDAGAAPPAPSVEVGREEPVVLAGSPRAEPRLADAGPAADSASAEGDIPPQSERVVDGERRSYLGAFVILALLAVIGGGIWWALQSGMFKLPAATEQAEAPGGGADAYDPDEEPVSEPARSGEAGADRNWITVFTADDPASVSAPSDAKAEAMEEDGNAFLRIRSGASDSAVVFDVGQGVLEQLAGKRVVFDIVARAEEGKQTQFSVNCNFGELGDCGRKRYAVGYEKSDFLFEIDLPDKRPGAAGTIAINSDIDDKGKAIDVFEIKASMAQ